MIRLAPASLQARVLWGTLAAVTLVWLAAAAWVALDTRHELEELFDAHLAQSAALLLARQVHEDDEDDDAVDRALNGRHGHGAPHRLERRVAFQLWRDGRLVMHSPNAGGPPLGQATAADGFETALYRGQAWRVFGARGPGPDSRVFVA